MNMETSPAQRLRLPSRRRARRSAGAFIDVEMVSALALIALIALTLARVLYDYGQSADAIAWRQVALSAAQAQLQRYQAGAPIDSVPPAGVLPDEVALNTHAEPATGQWQGFTRVTVTAEVTNVRGGPVREQACGYLPREVTP